MKRKEKCMSLSSKLEERPHGKNISEKYLHSGIRATLIWLFSKQEYSFLVSV